MNRCVLRSVVRCIGLAVLLSTATSCSIGAEDGPRNIAVGDRDDLSVDFDQAAGAATGSGRIYLLSPEVLGQPRTLQSVARDVADTPADAMRALFEGPNTQELQALLRSAIPSGTQLIDVSQNGDALVDQRLAGELLQFARDVDDQRVARSCSRRRRSPACRPCRLPSTEFHSNGRRPVACCRASR